MDDLDHSMHISDHDWISFFEEAEECCLLQAALACPDSPGLSDGDDLDFTTCTCTPLNEQQANGPQVVEKDFSSVICSAEEESNAEQGPVGSGPKPEPELPVTKGALSCEERVTVNDNPSSGTVLKKKRRHKKILRGKHKDGKDHICGSNDIKMKLKVPKEVFSDTNNESSGTEASLHHSDVGNITTKQNHNVRRGTCAEINKLLSPDTDTIQEVSTENHSIVPDKGSIQLKHDTGVDITKWMETSDMISIQERDPDLGRESCVEDNLDTSKSTKSNSSELDKEKETNLEDSSKFELQQLATNHTNNGLIVEYINTTNNTDLGAIHTKCKVESLESACKNQDESAVDPAKPIDHPVSLANSIESDEFADVEVFSSFSHDSETYHSAAESVEDPGLLSLHSSPCDLSISINNDSLADRGLHSCLQGHSSQPHSETSRTFPSGHLGADRSVDTPTSAGNASSSLGGQPELEVTMESPEAFAKATGNNQPVYAISAFWDEMEKLTINDILHIRMERCMLPVEEVLNTRTSVSPSCDGKGPTIVTPESAALDTVDAADSDYCTESKPGRSSCDFSTSDFEEEYWQFLNSSRNSSPDLHDKSYQSQCTDYVSTGEEESDGVGTPVPSEDCPGQRRSCESTLDADGVAVPHQMRKNKSMYDVPALKTMENLSSHAFQSSCKSLEENVSDRFSVVTDEHYQISFPDVFECHFDDNKAMSVSVYGLQENPALTMNNHVFWTTMNELPPEPIPIFSCSRPTVRELTSGCIFLGSNYTTMKDVSPIQMLSRSIVRSTDRAFSFSQEPSGLYSVKSICFLDKRSDVWMCHSEDEEKPADVADSSVTVVGEGGVFSMTPQMFKEAALRQMSVENQIPSDYQGIFSTIKQSDMCLVCIAFASWVLRSSDPKAADTWKAALLANVSALSAIQYLRQYMKKKTSPKDD